MGSVAEYEAYLRKIELPTHIAANAISIYDVNNDGNIDSLEWMKMNVDMDINGNGNFDFDELMNYYESITGMSFNVDLSNQTQHRTAFNTAKNYIINWDQNNDQMVDAKEYERIILARGYPDYYAANAISNFDLDGNGFVDRFEWMEAILSFDTNGKGLLDGEEKTNFYNSMS